MSMYVRHVFYIVVDRIQVVTEKSHVGRVDQLASLQLKELPEELVLGASTSSAVPAVEKVAQGRSWAEKEQHLGVTIV